jgi:hypothetical protein
MNICKKCRDLFDEALCQELDKEQTLFLQSHLKKCPQCRAQFEEANTILNFMRKKTRNEPVPGFFDDYWDKLQQRMEKETFLHAKREKKWIHFQPRWVFQVAAALVLLIIGIFIGRDIFPPAINGGDQQLKSPVITASFKPGTELFQRTHHFIERSKVILLAMINFDPKTEDSYILNLPYQQRVSRELVQQAGEIKNKLAGLDQEQLRELISDLEVILLQVANLDAEPAASAIKLVKNGVEIRGILFKMQLTDIRTSINKKRKVKRI